MQKLILAFIGRRGSGKDTAADEAAKQLFERRAVSSIQRIAFAEAIKEITHGTLGITTTHSEFLKRNPDIKLVNGLSLRETYNVLGDQLKSKFGRDIFTQDTISRIDPLADLTLVTDVRYPSEKEALLKYSTENNTRILFIKMINRNLFGVTAEPGEHESESLSDDIFGDVIIEASSVQEIHIKIKGVIDELSTTTTI